MNRIVSTFLFLTGLAVALSCTEDITPTPYTYTKLITGENSKTWKIKSYEYVVDGEVDDRFTVDCSSDDEYIFYAKDRAYQVDTGSKRCDETEIDLITDTWAFANSTATLTIILPAFTSEFALPFFVRELDDDDMELEIFLDNENTESYRIQLDAIDED
jgi:hypothetical protein